MIKTIYFNTEYVNQKKDFKEIPNGYIDKTICGCGLTSIALENNLDTIIAVPTIALVDNKINQYPNERYKGSIFGVKGGISDKDIEKYVYQQRVLKMPIKIMVTYDSLYKLESLFDTCKLVIDESDQLLKATKLKITTKNKDIDVITYLFNICEKYKDKVSFISATPIPLNYMPKWISKIPQYKFEFSNTIKITPITMKRTYPFVALKDEIIRPMESKGSVLIGDRKIDKCIIFINSVENIIKIIKDCNLNKEDVAILCSDTTRNDYKIRGYNRIDKPNNLPKYTFITSSGFEGIDLLDDTAINIVVSNTTKDCQMINLLTDLKQATSRQRNKHNPNYNRFIYIYNQNAFSKSEDELIGIIENTRKEIIENCSLLDDLRLNKDDRYLSTATRFLESKTFVNYTLPNKNNNGFIINDNAFNADKYFILETRKQFTKGFDVIGAFEVKPIEIEAPRNKSIYSYSALLDKYKNMIKGDNSLSFTKDEMVTENYILIDTYYKQYNGFTNNSSYAKKMIKVYNDDWKRLTYEIINIFPKGIYVKKEVKDKLNQLYNKYGIKRKAKITDLSNDFNLNIKETQRRVQII